MTVHRSIRTHGPESPAARLRARLSRRTGRETSRTAGEPGSPTNRHARPPAGPTGQPRPCNLRRAQSRSPVRCLLVHHRLCESGTDIPHNFLTARVCALRWSKTISTTLRRPSKIVPILCADHAELLTDVLALHHQECRVEFFLQLALPLKGEVRRADDQNAFGEPAEFKLTNEKA